MVETIKLELLSKETRLLVDALNLIDYEGLPDFDEQTEKLYISIRNDLEPRINRVKRRPKTKLKLKLFEALTVELALSKYVDLVPEDQQIYVASVCRTLIAKINPQMT